MSPELDTFKTCQAVLAEIHLHFADHILHLTNMKVYFTDMFRAYCIFLQNPILQFLQLLALHWVLF